MTKRFYVWAAAFVSVAGIAASSMPSQAFAATTGDALTEQTAQSPEKRAPVDLNIPAQSLDSALTTFADQAGLRLIFASEDVTGRRTDGLTGTLTPNEALKRLLAGTGMTWRFIDDKTIVLEKPAGGDAMTLDPITVEGQRASGPVEGYVAQRSAAGSKTDTPISDIPQSVSVITRGQIEARGARTDSEILAYSAGVVGGVRGDSSGLGGDNISIRGFGGNGGAGISFNEYWDGLRMQGTYLAASSIEPYLFERYEILRGPASVLYGQNQPGGIVNRVTKRPLRENHGEIALRGGSFDTKELDMDVGGPVMESDQFAFRMVGALSDRNAQTDFTSRERAVAAPSLSWRPSKDTSLIVQAVYQHDDIHGGYLNALPALGTVFSSDYGKVPRSRFVGDPNYDTWKRSVYSVSYLLDHKIDEAWSVRQNARFFRNELDLEDIGISSAPGPDGRTVERYAFSADEHANSYTIDNQGEARFGTGPLAHKMLFGADLQRTESDTFRRYGSAPTLDLYAPVYYQTITVPPVFQDVGDTRNQVGLYAQDQIRVDQWIVTLGGRHDWATSEITNKLTNTTTNTRDTAFTWRAGLGYTIANQVTPYLGYSESFQPQSGTDFDGDNFVPTTGQQYEVGVKYAPATPNVSVTLSAFQLTQQNLPTSDPDHPGFRIQTSEVRSRGIELEGVARPDNGWSFVGSYSYLDQIVTKSNTSNAGKRLATIPKHKAALWASHAFQQAPLRGFELGAGVRYVGSTAGDTANTFDVPAYTLFDASLSYDLNAVDHRLDGASLAVSATNLGDKTYVASCNSDDACYYGIGRTILGRIKYNW